MKNNDNTQLQVQIEENESGSALVDRGFTFFSHHEASSHSSP